MSDRYEHHFYEYTVEQYDDLLTLARYLVVNAGKIDAAGGLLFDRAYMLDFEPTPEGVAAHPPATMPPLAYGPLAGIAALPGEDWQDYCQRAFGIEILPYDPFCLWLQSPLWARTEPSALGAGLRIVYVLDLGVPHDHVEISMGQAWTDYDRSGFLWDKLGMVPDGVTLPLRQWPERICAPTLAARRAAITLGADNLRQTLIEHGIAGPEDIAGLSDEEIRQFEFTTGALPRSYCDVLSLIGLRAGRLVDDRELQIYADQLPEVNRMGRERRAEWEAEGGDPIPDDATFIGARYGMSPWFILQDSRAHRPPRGDSPVFLFDTDMGKVTQVSISVWGWVEGLVRDAEIFIAEGIPEKNARRGHRTELPPLALQYKQQAQRDRNITIIMMAGAVLLGTTLYLIYRLTT
ncbi:hypothetical protein [Maritimibacter fusiformis]|uniref:Knr4/Smi1-like domain-containing protein n=1 Tax=Maritimibacter fusiformis TaxID=2603819 RepID=A0A5D0RI90_9RHOB|nr:hypothetical protein [Maritimibacter fusiformis]TYB80789.1 hypothetical protein FVF75_12120 [Maritimibacter fusiformis]